MKINYSLTSFKAKKIPKLKAKQIDELLKKSPKVDIICHESTDSDAANSALAMKEYLKQFNISSRIIISQNLQNLPLRKKDNIIQAQDLKDETPDTILCVDFSSKKRISPKTVSYIKKAKQVICLDHHKGENLQKDVGQNFFYIDTSAKSATSIIYRLFEALNKKTIKKTAYDLFLGLISDCNKRGLISCDGTKGTITPSKEFEKDKDAFEIYNKLKRFLSIKEISEIAKMVDITSTLTPKEEKFRDSLYKKIKYSKNKKIAYVEIPPDDKIWQSLGGDNTKTSAILNKFRQNILKLNPNTKVAVTFYEAKNLYRVSLHAKGISLDEFYNYAQKNIPYNFSIGGHSDRGGGKLDSTEPETCKKWTEDIIKCLFLTID